jgi:hypothetical protein
MNLESDADRQELEEAMKRFDVSPIIERFGTWAVTTYGIECLERYYPIEFEQVDESDWLDHMKGKTWVDIGDFAEALFYARQLYGMRQAFIISGRPLKVFLCHGKEDKPSVRHLYHRLQAVGIKPWLDEEQILPGQDWKFEITKAVRQSDIVLVCLSRTSVGKTGFVQKEIKDALDAADERPEGMIFLIPARLEECEVPDRLRGRQWVDLFNPGGFDLLLKSLRTCCTSQQKT